TAERTVNIRNQPRGSRARRLRGRAPPERSTDRRDAPTRGAAGLRAPDPPAADCLLAGACLLDPACLLDAAVPAAGLLDALLAAAALRGAFDTEGARSTPRPERGADRDDAAPLDGRGAGGREAGGTGEFSPAPPAAGDWTRRLYTLLTTQDGCP